MPRPYQPSLLRILHGAMALLVPLAWLSGFIAYSNNDGRFGRLLWSIPGDWLDIHGSFGFILWPLALLFSLYALSLGKAKLRQPANTAALLALAAAVGSGKLMDEEWLEDGQLNHWIYSLHLSSWLLLTGTIIWHVIAVWRRGGSDLASSIFRTSFKGNDWPIHWPSQIIRWIRHSLRSGS